MTEALEYYPPGPVAAQFLNSTVRRNFLMGPVGSGKSTVCVMKIMTVAQEQKPNAQGIRKTRWAVVRNTMPQLRTTTVATWKQWIGAGFGKFVENPVMEHRIRIALDDGTKVHADVMFLALDQEKDIKKFLSLEVTGIWFNEVREIKRSLIDAGDMRTGRWPRMAEGGPTWHGILADTNMPDDDHWLHQLAEVEKPEGWAFFRQPGGVLADARGNWHANPNAENLANLLPDYYSGNLSGKKDEWVRVYLAAEYGRLPVEGAYYASDLDLAEREGRIGLVPPSPDLPVHTFWDLGISDDTSIWLGQALGGGQWKWVDYIEDRGKALDHYARILKDKAAERRFVYGDHVWPHDGGHRDPGILGGKTRQEVFEGLGFKTVLLPRHNIADGIDAARRLIRTSQFDSHHCREGLKKLRNYHREFNEARNVFNDRPHHDENSHCADAYRTAAMGQGRVSNSAAKWTAAATAGIRVA